MWCGAAAQRSAGPIPTVRKYYTVLSGCLAARIASVAVKYFEDERARQQARHYGPDKQVNYFDERASDRSLLVVEIQCELSRDTAMLKLGVL